MLWIAFWVSLRLLVGAPGGGLGNPWRRLGSFLGAPGGSQSLLQIILEPPDAPKGPSNEPPGALLENPMVPGSHRDPSRAVFRSFDLRNRPSQPQTDHKHPNISVAGVPFLSLSSSVVMKQGQAAEAAKTSGHLLHIILCSGHLLHIILGSGHCGGVGAQRS